MDLDAVGGAATGGLVSAAVSRPAGQAGQPHAVCADCGTETLGRFCHNCGNPSHVHRTLRHLAEEVLHGVMHFDGRTWRTLPLLVFRPGRLTREWVEGKRARYVSPLALFLFTVFVMFLVLSYAPAGSVAGLQGAKTDVANALSQRQATIAGLEKGLASVPPERRGELADALQRAKSDLAASIEDAKDLGEADALVGGDWKTKLAVEAKAGRLKFDLGDKALNEKVRHKLENPDLAIYKLQQTFYKFSFLLVPISIPFVALLFLWKRGVTLYDHGVFILYSLTFMSVLAMAVTVASRPGGGVGSSLADLLVFAAPAHMFFQLKGAYGLKVWGAAWRTLVLLVFCAVALTLFILAVIMLGLG